MTNSKNYKLTKEDFKQINKRSLFTFQLGWNYERMQASGYLYMLLPQLEKDGVNSKDAVNGIKTGLMGPFAPLGDSIFGSLVPAIMGSIAATIASQGQPWGIFLWIAVAVAYDIFRWKQLEFAYKEGTNLINNMQSTLTALIEAASVLGIFMVGALIATMINVDVTWMPHIGDKAIDIQDMLNLIFPRLVPAIITGVIYWLLGRKGMNSTKAILLIIVAAIAFSAFGHFCFGMQ